MRIAMVSEHASPLTPLGDVDSGGQNLHVAELSTALARRGHEVCVYTRRHDPALPDRTTFPPGVEVVHVSAGPPDRLTKDDLLPHMGQFGEFLAADWEDRRPDIAHAHFWMSGLAALRASERRDIPVVQTFHALGTVKRRHQGSADTSPVGRIRLERMVGRTVARIVATCSDEVFEIIRMGVPRSQITVVPCGVDLDTFTPGGQSDRSPMRIVCVGRLVPRKGFDTVISAMRLLPTAELLIAGGPRKSGLENDAEARRLRAHAARHGVADRVFLLGQVDRARMPELLRSADVVVCAPWYEPFGIVPLEAMACGIPVVATAVGGLTDTVVHGVTGLHVPPRDVRALALALRSLLKDPAKRLSYGIAGRDRAEARYSWNRIAQDNQRIYERVLAERRRESTVAPSSSFESRTH